MKEKEMKQIASLIDKTLNIVRKYNKTLDPDDKSYMDLFNKEELQNELNLVKKEVLSLCKKFPIYN